MNINIEQEVHINPQDLTIRYIKKLIEQTKLFIVGQQTQTELEKFCLFKTVSMNISFACELLLKTIIHNYSNGNDYKSWNTHNLLTIFDKLEQQDKDTISEKLNLSIQDIELILQDKNTAEAYEKRYLYESGTGIPNYDFLCEFLNVLFEINNINLSFNSKQITSLPLDYDTTQFGFEEIIKTHTQMLYDKAETLEINYDEDPRDVYVVKNIKSCDYALFAELRFKYFDKEQRPKTEHEFSVLHKRLEEACKFLVAKSRYMDRYMSKDATIDFVWTLESLLFSETFNAGETVKELYADINETFKNSRYCTSEHYDNYSKAKMFARTVKSITDLLMLNESKANKILQTKQSLIDEYGDTLLESMEFTVEEMYKIDITYLKQLDNIRSVRYLPKTILLENNPIIREKIFFYLSNSSLRNYEIPTNIDYIVETINGTYTVNQDKLRAYFKLKNKEELISETRIDKYIELSKYIKEDKIIIYIINQGYDVNQSIQKYTNIVSKCLRISSNHNEISSFLRLHGRYLIDSEVDSTIYKMYVIEKFFNSQPAYKDNIHDNDKTAIIAELSKYPFDEIVRRYTLFKSFKLDPMFFNNTNTVMKLDFNALKERVKRINQHRDFLSQYYGNDGQILDTDINKLIQFIKRIGNLNPKNEINTKDFNSGEAEKLYKKLKDTNMLFIYETKIDLSILKNHTILDEVSNKNIIKSNISRYNKEEKQGIADLIVSACKYPPLKAVLLDLLDTTLILDAPDILTTLTHGSYPLKTIYSLNIFSSWYDRIKNNDIKPGGNKENLTPNEINNIKQLLIQSIKQTGIMTFTQSELTKRLETIFSNNKLLHSINEEILTTYDLSFMLQTVKDCKLRYNEIDNFNLYGHLFNTIQTNNITPSKIIELLNKLSESRKNPKIKAFIRKICDTPKDFLIGEYIIKINDENKSLTDETLDIIIAEITDKNQQEIVNYISSIDITLNRLLPDDEDIPYFLGQTYEERKRFGLEVLLDLKAKTVTKTRTRVNKLAEMISNSYLSQKIMAKKLEHDYKRVQEEGNDYGRKR